jgi:hypothetical protein
LAVRKATLTRETDTSLSIMNTRKLPKPKSRPSSKKASGLFRLEKTILRLRGTA